MTSHRNANLPRPARRDDLATWFDLAVAYTRFVDQWDEIAEQYRTDYFKAQCMADFKVHYLGVRAVSP